jgi:hypothetical protein
MTAVYLFSLAAFAFLLNLDALSGNWRFDDGWILDFASRFSPLEYFFNPAITRGYSLNNLTPSNPLIFDINLWLFGFNPKGFYLQHLASLAGCALASFLLLRIWMTPLIAFLGATLFLAGAPSLFVAQQLMVGHYIAGLFFAILAIYTYRRNLEEKRWQLTLLATLFYIMATSCKEVYFPLPFVIVFFQHERLSTRIVQALPMFAWSAGYMLWRHAVLGSFIGGYDRGGHSFSILEALQSYAAIPELLFPTPYLAWMAMVVFMALIVYKARSSKLNALLFIAAVLAVMLPLAPLTQTPGITQANRYLLLPWWLFSVTLAGVLAHLPRLNITYKSSVLLLFIAFAGVQAWQEKQRLTPKLDQYDALYGFVLSASPERILYSAELKDAYYLDTVLNGARYAQARVAGEKAEKLGILVNSHSLTSVDLKQKSVWSYGPGCQCIHDISSEISARKGAKSKPPNLIVVPLSPPYPPLFQVAQGELKLSRISPRRVRLEGLSKHPVGDLEHELVLITPERPQRYQVALGTTQHAPSEPYTFRLFLDYRDRDAADRAAKQSCLLIRSAHTPLGLLVDKNLPSCRHLVTSRP